jgi:hypothetical protein
MRFLLTMIFLIISKRTIATLIMTLSNTISSVVSLLIKAHFGHPTKIRKGSMYNVLVEWETGEATMNL